MEEEVRGGVVRRVDRGRGGEWIVRVDGEKGRGKEKGEGGS